MRGEHFGVLLRFLREATPTLNPQDPRSSDTVSMGEMARILGTSVSFVSAVETDQNRAQYTDTQLAMFAQVTGTQLPLLKMCRRDIVMLRLALSLHPRYDADWRSNAKARHRELCGLMFGDKERTG